MEIKTKQEIKHENVKNGEIKKDKIEKWLDAHFESPFFKTRYILLVPVICSFIAALLAFYIGTYQT